LKKILWSSYLGPSPPLPYDVIFRIIEEERVTGHIGAHRYLLATCSSVFRTEFFGLLADREKVIDIKETSLHAFRYLVDYIYGIKIKFEIDMEAQELFEILNIAERYDVQQLKEDVTEQLKTLQIEARNVVEVARVAEAYNHFESVSTSVLSSCSKLLKELLATDAELAEFCDRRLQFDDDRKLVTDLMEMGDGLEADNEDDIGNIIQELFQSDEPKNVEVNKEGPPANLGDVNWIELMDPNNGVPPDVCFKIVESPCDVLKKETRIAGEVFAHKYLLAAISDFFRERFFNCSESRPSSSHLSHHNDGSLVERMSEENINEKEELIETIQIECSSLNAFKVMINYMYGKYPTLRGADEICEMFEIMDLAERFTVSGLEEEYRTAMFLYFRERPRWTTQPIV